MTAAPRASVLTLAPDLLRRVAVAVDPSSEDCMIGNCEMKSVNVGVSMISGVLPGAALLYALAAALELLDIVDVFSNGKFLLPNFPTIAPRLPPLVETVGFGSTSGGDGAAEETMTAELAGFGEAAATEAGLGTEWMLYAGDGA